MIKIKICPKCGISYECMNQGDCWCSNYEIPLYNRKILKSKYNNCLCEACLKEYAEIKEEKLELV